MIGFSCTHGDTLELFELAEEIFDQVAPFVDLGVDCGGARAAWMLRDDNLGATRIEIVDDRIAIESLIGQQRAEFDACNQWGDADGIEAVPRQQEKADKVAERICQGQDLRGQSGLWPGSESPFCALTMTVDFDDRGVDHGIFHVRLCRHRIEQPFENIRLHPVAVALEHRVPASERRRQIAPRAAGPNDPQHRLDKAPIVAPTPARIAWLPKAMGFHLRPLGVSQNKSIHVQDQKLAIASVKWNVSHLSHAIILIQCQNLSVLRNKAVGTIIIILLVMLLLGGGGGYYGYNRYGTSGLSGVLILVLIVLAVLWFMGNGVHVGQM